MKKNYRELFVLFKVAEPIKLFTFNKQMLDKAGYTLIHKHTFPNDEPPYIMVSYYGITSSYDIQRINNLKNYEDEEEDYSLYLIRSDKAKRFCKLTKESQNDYCDYYNEGIMTRNAGEHNLSAHEYAQGSYQRPFKIKILYVAPKELSETSQIPLN